MLPWVKNVNVTMSAQPARPVFAGQLPAGLQTISNIIAVSSCKVRVCTTFFVLQLLAYWCIEILFMSTYLVLKSASNYELF